MIIANTPTKGAPKEENAITLIYAHVENTPKKNLAGWRTKQGTPKRQTPLRCSLFVFRCIPCADPEKKKKKSQKFARLPKRQISSCQYGLSTRKFKESKTAQD